MRTRNDTSSDKLRGGYYSPSALVDLCLERVSELTRGMGRLRLIEPSAGDGAFVRGLSRNQTLAQRTATFDAIELLASEAAICAAEIDRSGFLGRVRVDSAIRWASTSKDEYEVAVGNPPYVRFQFVPESERRHISHLETKIGVSFSGLSNLWLPVLLGALSRLVIGGAFAFIVPAECFTGVSAGVLRKWLIQNSRNLRFDLFPPGSFPLVLQEVVILSGTRAERSNSSSSCEFHEYRANNVHVFASHIIAPTTIPWTKYLLSKTGIDALEEAANLAEVWSLNQIAKFEVAAVTGANEFFSVDNATLAEFDLGAWSTPLLPRLRHAEGLRYTILDHRAVTQSGAKTHLLDFSKTRPDPTNSKCASKYLTDGVTKGLPERYKCRIRTPWYRIPFIKVGQLLMSKRSHNYPKVVVNDAGVVTTDTIYRGSMIGNFLGREDDFAASFHNSLTLLTAEVEGRSFGGGVLELVPSEVARLLIPLPFGFGVEIERLDKVARAESATKGGDELVYETDLLLAKADIGFSTDLLDRLHSARKSLLQRRLDRSSS